MPAAASAAGVAVVDAAVDGWVVHWRLVGGEQTPIALILTRLGEHPPTGDECAAVPRLHPPPPLPSEGGRAAALPVGIVSRGGVPCGCSCKKGRPAHGLLPSLTASLTGPANNPARPLRSAAAPPTFASLKMAEAPRPRFHQTRCAQPQPLVCVHRLPDQCSVSSQTQATRSTSSGAPW